MKPGFTAVSQTAGLVPEMPRCEVFASHPPLIAAVAGSFYHVEDMLTREDSSLLAVSLQSGQGSCPCYENCCHVATGEPAKEAATAILRICRVGIQGDALLVKAQSL
jgi:hypothetical protein